MLSQPDVVAEPDLDLAHPDLESLPSVESINENTDIRSFLASGVPAELMRTALRRTWASDPTIRDFIGIAENQWDFNDPNAIPGFGVLRRTDDVPALLAQALRPVEQVAEAPPGPVIPPELKPTVELAPRNDPLEEARCGNLPSGDPNAEAPDAADAAMAGRAQTGVNTVHAEHSPPRRPHGGALPR